MVDKLDTAYPEPDSTAVSYTGGVPTPASRAQPGHTQIHGRFNQYTSGFWGLALPMLGARYTGRWISNLLHWGEATNSALKQRAYGFFVAGVMLATTALYAGKTWGDIKRVFAETIAYEMDKKPEDVTMGDFFHSKNTIVHETIWNFIKRNSLRALFVNAPFFNFLIPGVLEKPGIENSKSGMSIYNAVDLGVGGTSAYLAADAINRKQTFFEALQNFIDHKINHDDNMGQPITMSDLTNLYTIHVRDNDQKGMALPSMDTAAWKNDQILFNRMADLMNKTYRNTPTEEPADFTIPKLLYLLGHGIVKVPNLEENLAFIEVANRYGIPAVKEVSTNLHKGIKLEDAIRKYPVSIKVESREMAELQQDNAKFVDKIGESRQQFRPPSAPAASYVEKAASQDNIITAVTF